MGVPKFYRWISERYPKINQIVSDNALLPEFDHLYLDMNGIIHGCTHPPGMDLADGLSERDMMLGIMHYLDRIITQIVKPKVSVYMAIDGVAPRAKLNQQRSRRFRSAKDLAEASKDLKTDEHGKTAAVFDSNCITPGTDFLAHVSAIIQYFIRKKIKEDPAWHGLSIIFSGHDIPGEGEHKIMQHIREMRCHANYQPNTRHCIYGQDADLIMLGLVTHEPHFTILREVVDFGGGFNNNKNAHKVVKKFTKESDFQLLHLSVLREYLHMEFVAYPQDPRQPEGVEPNFDSERCIDDFVFMTFLVGNDFLPHMPTLDIGDGAFDLLFNIYKEQRHGWGNGQYLTERGEICDATRLEKFLAAIGAVESEIFEQREVDDVAYTKKRRQWDKRDGKKDTGPSDTDLVEQEAEKQNDYSSMIETMLTKHKSEDFVDGWTPATEAGTKDFKGRYYYEKMRLTPVNKGEHWALRRSYMEGLRWCLAYYYKGCISWGWFYPYHYGPMLSDLINIPQMFEEIQFELGEPLTPFQQLMGCLPPASSTLVPRLYRWLMTSPDSPIMQFYPEEFDVDMNGKKNPWEGVNLLPFIEIKLLKDTIATHCSPTKLSADERTRNSIGKIFGYKFDPTCTDVVPSPSDKIGLADIAESHSSVVIHEENLGLSNLVFEPKLILGTQVPFPGFPSLNVLPIASGELASVGLNCFGFPSKYPNVILTMQEMIELPPIEQLAEIVIGKSLFVNWPMMHEGRVVAVTDANQEVRVVDGLFKIKEHTKLASDRWSQDSEMIAQTYYTGNGVPGSGGIQIGDIKIRLKVLPLQGMRTNAANGSTKKVFGNEEADVPLQLALWQAPVVDPRFIERGPMTLQERFPVDCNVVLTKGKLRGCSGVVVGTADGKNVGVKVMTLPPEIPFGLVIASSVQEAFVSSYDAARVLKINPGVFGKIVGRLPFEQGRYDLGLNLKSADGFCVIGYTRKKPEDHKAKKQGQKGGVWTVGDSVLVVGSRSLSDEALNEERLQWEYTPKAIRLVESYRTQFPQLFYAIGKMPNERKYDAYQVFGDNGEAWLPKVREWLDNDESAKLPRSPVTTESMSYEATAAIQKAADVRSLALKKKGYPQVSLVKVPGSALYREGSTGATDILLPTDINDSDKPQLGERVVNLCADGVPFGARGTVVGIHSAAASGSVELLMDEEFIGGTSLQGHCSNFRGKLCHWSHVLRITPENGKGVVDQLVPVNSKQADVNTILALAAPNKPERSAGSWDAHVDSFAHAAKSLNSTPMRSADRAKSRTPPRSSSRAGSTGRNRLITWKEARGPDEKGLGFKQSTRGGANGLTRWKKIIQARQISQITTAFEVEQTAKDLKRMLGLTSPPSASASTPQGHTAQLKAILGVTPGSNQVPNNTPAVQAPPVADTTTTNVSDGLKAILGVGPTLPPPVHVEPLPPPPPSTAAEQLLQLMAGKMQSQGPPNFFQPVAPSAFNFTYVDAGQEAPPPAAPPPTSHAPPHYFNNNYQNGYFPIMPQYGSVPPPTAHLLSNPAYYGTPAGYGGVAVATRHPIQPSGPSLVEFPPLNGSATAAVDTAAAAVVTVAALSSTDTTNPVLNQQPPVAASLMVPSVVQGRL